MSEHPSPLVRKAQAEKRSSHPECGHVQNKVPENVCVRDKGHDGPHVGHVAKTWVQWEF